MRDVLGGYARMQRQGEDWGRRWRRNQAERTSGLREWLTRPSAGMFWISSAEAPQWARDTCTEHDIRIAEASVLGTFDLLGSGAVSLGVPPRWRTDLYTGEEWPLDEASRVNLARSDGSDIRTVWELARCYHFLPLARAYWKTGHRRFIDAFFRDADSWVAQNPMGYGPHWASSMDVAIRAANWILATVLFGSADGSPAAFWERYLGHLFGTGLYLERYLEWHPIHRGNHYVADAVGLIYLGTLFRDERTGQRWLAAGARILSEEIERQVHDDGVFFEAALGYHRLATELFTMGGDLVRRNSPERLRPQFDDRLRKMFLFLSAYLPPSGEAPMLGDADDGRLHALSAEGLGAPRRHRLGLPKEYFPAESGESLAFPNGGFYVLRCSIGHLIIRCGAVGLMGGGSHDHNDQLSFELTVGNRRVVSDSGTYTYTRDLAARQRFRATAAHSVIQIDAEEQNPIDAQRPWSVLADRTRAECIRWDITPECQVFEGQHYGYSHRPSGALCRRRVTAKPHQKQWEVLDRVSGHGREPLTWRMHLAPCTVMVLRSEPIEVEVVLSGEPQVRILVQFSANMEFTVGESEASDRYGSRYRRPCLNVEGLVTLPVTIRTTFSIEAGS